MLSSTCRRRPGSPTTVVRHVARDVAGQLEAFLCARERQRAATASPTVSRRSKSRRLELQPPRFDLREVEDVVDDVEQRVGRRLHGRQVVALLGRQRVSSASDVMPRMALSGVRISWLMFARNALFARSRLRPGAWRPRARGRASPASLRLLALGDVARGGVDDLLLGKRRRRPEQPADRAVLVDGTDSRT